MQSTIYELSDFEVLESLGQGSFSKVKLVRRISDGKIMALKQVYMDKLGMNQKNSALNQIRLLASIQSPYVISYEGSFYSSSTNSLCLLMEYADSGDLQNLINKTAKKTKMESGLSEEFIWRTIIHLLQGLKTLHQNKIVHRDIKSANIFYCKNIAKIGDLNVSSVSDSSFYSTKTGTPYYTAPEIWKGEKYTNNCDIWSLGCIVYEMCALLPPFKAQTFPQLFVAVSRGYYQPLPKTYSEDIRTFIRMCLTVDQFQRPSASELLESPVILKRLNDYKEDLNFSGKVELIKPIKCPKVLRFINTVLPQAHQASDDKTSIQGQQTQKKSTKSTRKKRTVMIDEPKKSESSIKEPSLCKSKFNIQSSTSTKSAIRIRSCNRLKTTVQTSKSVKLIKDVNFEDKDEQETAAQASKTIHLPSINPTQDNKVVKNEKFRLRSYKKIGQKQNIN